MDDLKVPKDLCRTCGGDNAEVCIFSENGEELQLADKINAYLPISVFIEDKLPLALCQVCVDRLESCHQLIVSCIETDGRLRKLDPPEKTPKAQEEMQVDDKIDDCLSKMLIQNEEIGQEELYVEQIVTPFINIDGTGLVAPNVYVVPFFNSKQNKTNKNEKGEELPKNVRGYYCDGCEVWIKGQYRFITHQLHCHLMTTFTCVICQHTAVDNMDLVKHMEAHNSEQYRGGNSCGETKCPVCSRVLSSKLALRLHIRTHSGEKPYSCKHCNKAFTQKNALNYHEKTHSNIKLYHCTICKKGFNEKLLLKAHERTHTGERPYVCDVCSAAFRCLSNLRQHRQIHSDDKPFQCSACCKTFHRPEKLRVHFQSHNGEKPYTCAICLHTFSQKSYLVKHIMVHNSRGETLHEIKESKTEKNNKFISKP